MTKGLLPAVAGALDVRCSHEVRIEARRRKTCSVSGSAISRPGTAGLEWKEHEWTSFENGCAGPARLPERTILRWNRLRRRSRRAGWLKADDGVAFLYRSGDILAVGWMANQVRERMHGDIAYFNLNRHINPTNVCVASCRLCAFRVEERRAGNVHDGSGRGLGGGPARD